MDLGSGDLTASFLCSIGLEVIVASGYASQSLIMFSTVRIFLYPIYLIALCHLFDVLYCEVIVYCEINGLGTVFILSVFQCAFVIFAILFAFFVCFFCPFKLFDFFSQNRKLKTEIERP